jgi:hypothetical protein
MAANKSKTTQSKGKTDATKNAQQRAQRQKHLPEAPPMTRSHRAVDQDRAGSDSPLAGADRPMGRRRGKVDRPMPAGGTAGGRTKVHAGEETIRRSRGMRGDSRR